MACVEVHDAATVTLKSKDLDTHGFQKKFQTPTKTRRSRAQFQKGQPIPLGWRVLATNLLLLTNPGLKPTIQNSSPHKLGRVYNAERSTF